MKIKTAMGSIPLESNQYDVARAHTFRVESATLVHCASYGTYSEYALYHPSGDLLPFRAILNDSSFWFHIEPTTYLTTMGTNQSCTIPQPGDVQKAVKRKEEVK